MKEKLTEKYIPEYYRNHLLDQIHNLFRVTCPFKIT